MSIQPWRRLVLGFETGRMLWLGRGQFILQRETKGDERSEANLKSRSNATVRPGRAVSCRTTRRMTTSRGLTSQGSSYIS